MKISPIYNNYVLKNYSFKRQNPSEPVFTSRTGDFFSKINANLQEIEVKRQENKQRFKEFIFAPHKVTYQEYQDIKEKYPFIFCKAQKEIDKAQKYYRFKSSPKKLGKIAQTLKKEFDESFGENKYRIISLGTSPACVTELMKEMGSEVIFLPISHIHEFCYQNAKQDKSRSIYEFKNIDVALDYLQDNNIDDKKINVILDFTVNKATLNIMYFLIKERFNLHDDKIKKCDLIQYLQEIIEESEEKNINKRVVKKLNYDLFNNITEMYVNVPHFSISDDENKCRLGWIPGQNREKEEVFYDFENYSRKLGRCFMLIGLKELDNIGVFKQKKSGQNPD